MTKKRFKIERHCNECGAELIIATGGFIVCQECGLTHDKIFDDREAPIILDGEEFAGSKFHGDGISYATPHISSTLKQYIPKRFKNSKIGRLIKKYEYVSQEIIKNKVIFNELKKICNKYSMINHLYSHCCHFYKKINDELEFRGRGNKNELIAWLIVYIQCRIYNIPFSFGFLKQVGLSNNDIRTIRKKFFYLKDRYNIKIYNAGINKSLWVFLNYYVKEPYLRTLLQKNILKLVAKKYSHFNVPQKRILIVAILYILLKKFKYSKISYRDLSKKSLISETTIRKYVNILKN